MYWCNLTCSCVLYVKVDNLFGNTAINKNGIVKHKYMKFPQTLSWIRLNSRGIFKLLGYSNFGDVKSSFSLCLEEHLKPIILLEFKRFFLNRSPVPVPLCKNLIIIFMTTKRKKCVRLFLKWYFFRLGIF